VTQCVRVLALLAMLWSAFAHAHKPSDSYLTLTTTPDRAEITAQWDIALRDLEYALGVDGNGDGTITWGELQERQEAVQQYALAHLSIGRADAKSTEPCPLAFNQLLIDEHVDGTYAVLRFRAVCAALPQQIAVRYSLLFDVDPNHRGLLDLRSARGSQAVVLSPAAPEFVTSATRSGRAQAIGSFIREGVSHILQGYDHILFLITLLLPAVVLFRNGRWEPHTSLREAALDVAKVVTAFTLAHSLTLSIAVLGWVTLPSRFVESAIAFTVVLGALNNLYPIVTQRRWLAAFVFGLIHGFGFASVLADLGLHGADLGLALLGFNVGVELGQLGIVVLLIPAAYLARTTLFYRRVFMPAGAVLICGLAGYWFVERAFDVTLSS
jgi:hypothetical protein